MTTKDFTVYLQKKMPVDFQPMHQEDSHTGNLSVVEHMSALRSNEFCVGVVTGAEKQK